MSRIRIFQTVPRAVNALGRLADSVDTLAREVATLAGTVASLNQTLERRLPSPGPRFPGSRRRPN